MMSYEEQPILHVLVVGFHHKKGCQVEYSYPRLVEQATNECPAAWKYLPSLALPDGSHNFNEDTVFFHLPSLTNPNGTVFGISCYRQIPIEKIRNKTVDITRGTVQKAVCVLSRIPLYGQIQVKMSLITQAYFDEGDFSKVSILEDTFHHLNSVLKQSELTQHLFVGLSARDFVLQWKHKALLLFKLILLEKRLLFFKSPVHPLCCSILTLLSLFPEMIEVGLQKSACIRLSQSPSPTFTNDQLSPIEVMSATECHHNQNNDCIIEHRECTENEGSISRVHNIVEIGHEITESMERLNEKHAVENLNGRRYDVLAMRENGIDPNSMKEGFPLNIFDHGYVCLPYLSLSYLDLLTDVNVRGYVVGATNILFKQKRHLYDVLVDVDSFRVECDDLDLRRQLHLTTEDLRFSDFVVKHVGEEEKHDVFLDGVGWEGGDEWIRAQFRLYLICLLRTSLVQDNSRELEHFNVGFMQCFRETHNYKMWLSKVSPESLLLQVGHPFAGQLSVADMKLRLAHTIANTDGGRKLNQAVLNTGRAMATTGKAVGGAITQAKGVLSNWWSNLQQTTTNVPTPVGNKGDLEPANVDAVTDDFSNDHSTTTEHNQTHPNDIVTV